MMYINYNQNLCYGGPQKIEKPGWESVTNEYFNDLMASGWIPLGYYPPHRVSKDTVTSRVVDANKLNDLMALIASLPAEQQFLWTNFAWFWSDNQTIVSMCQQLGLDPLIILAEDPYI